MKILLIDDHQNTEQFVNTGMRAMIGSDFTMQSLRPITNNGIETMFGLPELQRASFYEQFDLIFLDLELKGEIGKLKNKTTYDPDDLQGGSLILPQIRNLAPWLPVIGFSQLLDNDSAYWLSVITSFGFDATISKSYFESNKRTTADWRNLFESVKHRRQAIARGLELSYSKAGTSIPIVDMNESLRKTFDNANQFESLVAGVFPFAKSISLQEISPGFSGARVFSALVKSSTETGARNGHWLLKISQEVAKLNAECQSHSEVYRRGVPFARTVPLIWPGIIVENGMAAIAYQFAENSTVGPSYLRKEGFVKLLEKLRILLNSYYESGRTDESAVLGALLQRTLPSSKKLEETAATMQSWILGQDYLRLVREVNTLTLDKHISFTSSLIHRDLHLSNVLLGERDVIIDFALSAVGPLAFDYARIVVDTIINEFSLLSKVLKPNVQDDVILDIVTKLDFEKIARGADDLKLLSMFIELTLGQLMGYSDISVQVKSEIERILLAN